MSLSTFFNNVWREFKKVFERLPKKLKDAIHIGVVVTEKLKTWVENPTVDILTYIIPGELDDKIKQLLREALPKILINLKLAEKCSELTDPVEIVKCAVETLQSIEGDFQSAFLHDISIFIAQVAADGKLSWEDGVHILELYYRRKFKKQ